MKYVVGTVKVRLPWKARRILGGELDAVYYTDQDALSFFVTDINGKLYNIVVYYSNFIWRVSYNDADTCTTLENRYYSSIPWELRPKLVELDENDDIIVEFI